MRRLLVIVAVGLLGGVAAPAQAITLRYALVLGNNRGFDRAQGDLPQLRHAAREATRLHARLLEVAGFDPAPERTVLLLGATRAQLLQAVATLIATKQRDLERFKGAETLFALFFTGHGMRGRLLLEDGALGVRELGKLLRDFDASVTIGVFDACFSGSLGTQALADKGVRPTPGVNLFRELPEEVLTAAGSIWFVSSGPNQVSYEDEELGGVFTHFFVEALAEAERTGPGIELERIWQYARQRTVDYTTARSRRQTPEQYVARLKATGPLYFSFPQPRTATLELGAATHGRFVLSYAEGQLTEVVDKARGDVRRLAVYPGTVRLLLLEADQVQVVADLELVDGGTVVVRSAPDPRPDERLGTRHQPLWAKGIGEQQLVATSLSPASSVLVGLEYDLLAVGAAELVAPRQHGAIALRLDRAGLVAGMQARYGVDHRRFPAWGYRSNAWGGELALGSAWDVERFRVTLTGVVGGEQVWQRFDDGARRQTRWWRAGARISGLYPTDGRLAVAVTLTGTEARSPGAAVGAGLAWRPLVSAGLAVLGRIW